MTDRDRAPRRTSETDEAGEDAELEEPVDREAVEEIDDLLDEIDSVLEENAEEFVRNYVQKGGE
jgi:prokaryotic ubiquitin-like protein Pup